MKLNLLRLPLFVARDIDYTDDSMDVAFVIPVFCDGGVPYLPLELKLNRQLTYVKGSLVQANALRTHTDVCDRRIPIYFWLDEDIYLQFSGLYESLGIKTNRILRGSASKGVVKERRVSKKFLPLKNPVLSDYNELFIADADFFFASRDANNKLEIAMIQGDCLAFTWYSKHHNRGDALPNWRGWFAKWRNGDIDKMSQKNFETSQKQLMAYNPEYAIDFERWYHMAAGGLLRVPRKRPPGFVEFCLDLDPLVGDDELILSIYTTHIDPAYDKFESINKCLHFAYSPQEMIKQREKGPYLLHLVSRQNEQEDWEALYHHDIGAVLCK